jgi:hypothetical protein
MPKVGGKTISECMSICMGDETTIREYPNIEKRREVCYAACASSLSQKHKAIEHRFVVTAQDGKYFIDGEPNPNLILVRGKEYSFELNVPGHPFLIKTEKTTGSNGWYAKGVVNNGTETATLGFDVPLDAPNPLYYNCLIHDTMNGVIEIVNEGEMSVMQ